MVCCSSADYFLKNPDFPKNFRLPTIQFTGDKVKSQETDKVGLDYGFICCYGQDY